MASSMRSAFSIPTRALAATSEPESGQRLAGSLWLFWERRGYLTEGRSWLEAMVAISSAAAAPTTSRALTATTAPHGDIRRAGGLKHQRADPAQRVLQAHPLLHDLDRSVHPAPEDRAELVHEPFDHETGDGFVIPSLRRTHDKMALQHPAIVSRQRPAFSGQQNSKLRSRISRTTPEISTTIRGRLKVEWHKTFADSLWLKADGFSADKPLSHKVDREERQDAREDQDPHNVH